MVESMTPVKKLLSDEEKEKEREEEEHIDQQRTRLHFLIKLKQVKSKGRGLVHMVENDPCFDLD